MHTRAEDPRVGDRRVAEIVHAWFESRGERVTALGQGEPLEIVMEVRFHEPLADPIFAFALRNEMGHTVFVTSSPLRGVQTGSFEQGDVALVRVALENRFAPSLYKVTPSVARAGAGADAIDMREDVASVMLHATQRDGRPDRSAA